MDLVENLIERFLIEFKKLDRSGIYGFTQRTLAYNSNKIEGSTLNEEQTAALFEHGIIPKNKELLEWYNSKEKNIETITEFHARYETIHPFQDGNGRTGRLIVFRECLVNKIIPIILEDKNGMEYIDGIKKYRDSGDISDLLNLMKKEQEVYKERCEFFL